MLLTQQNGTFTQEQVIEKAFQKYGKPVSLDFIRDAMMCETLDEAVDVIVTDSYYWDEDPEDL